MNPAARKSGLVVRELPDEIVVYDLDRHRAHCLNRTAAAVFQAADGRHDVAGLAARLAREGGSVDEDVVRMTLEQLAEAGLLERAVAPPSRAGVSRRDAVRKVGLGAAVLLPLVTSILVPTAAEAIATCVSNCTGREDGTPCTCMGTNPCTAACIAQTCSETCP
jgi:Coenzyme PQQ synthesis protein D (PqqD)